jgi:GTPase SAR1 family protein
MSSRTKVDPGMIITDDVACKPVLDFEAYRDTVVKMIMKSHPKFSIGIYGEWGSGKTTLMQSIYDNLEKKEGGNNNSNDPIIPVWFNAWRYDREEHFALILLLKTIEINIPEKNIVI